MDERMESPRLRQERLDREASEHKAGYPLPPRRPLAGKFDAAVRLARPIGFYACLVVMLVNGIVPPIAAVFGKQVAPIDWAGLAVFASPILAFMAARTIDKANGVTS